jgi:hypothetical protein
MIDADKHAQVRIDTGEVVAVGYFPTRPHDKSVRVIELTPEQREAIQEQGTSVLKEDGTIVTTYVEPEQVQQPEYGDDGELDNAAVRQAVSNLRLYVAAKEPSQAFTATTVRILCVVALYMLKRYVRLY